jgi:hypothetical protein
MRRRVYLHQYIYTGLLLLLNDTMPNFLHRRRQWLRHDNTYTQEDRGPLVLPVPPCTYSLIRERDQNRIKKSCSPRTRSPYTWEILFVVVGICHAWKRPQEAVCWLTRLATNRIITNRLEKDSLAGVIYQVSASCQNYFGALPTSTSARVTSSRAESPRLFPWLGQIDPDRLR